MKVDDVFALKISHGFYGTWKFIIVFTKPLLDPILSYFSPVPYITPCFSNTGFNIVL